LLFFFIFYLVSCDSFANVNKNIYANPLVAHINPRSYSGVFPKNTGATIFELGHIILPIPIVSDRIQYALNRTLTSTADWRPVESQAAKLFHSMGVCASATWEIIQGVSQNYTGLFAQGTKVNAIVRLSVGSDNVGTSKSPPVLGIHRVPAIAIKLFPTQDPNLNVYTQNILAFDSNGFDGNNNPWYLQGNWWSSWLYGNSLVTKGFVKSFERFVDNGRFQSVRHAARVNQNYQLIPEQNVRSPALIKITTTAPKLNVNNLDDYRKELMLYGDGEIKLNIIAIPNQDPDALINANTVIGRVTLNSPVISNNCDYFLHFHHSDETK